MLGESTAYAFCSAASRPSRQTSDTGRQDTRGKKKGLRSTWCIPALAAGRGNSLSVKSVAFFLTENLLWCLIFHFFQVVGSGVSSLFALCLGQTSSFCKAIVFASASVGLQTFNHR